MFENGSQVVGLSVVPYANPSGREGLPSRQEGTHFNGDRNVDVSKDFRTSQIPEAGFLRLTQIIGQTAVTEEQAVENRKRCKGARRARAAIAGIIPIKKSCWWAGVKSGRFPKPVKIGNGRGTFWRVKDILALIQTP